MTMLRRHSLGERYSAQLLRSLCQLYHDCVYKIFLQQFYGRVQSALMRLGGANVKIKSYFNLV